MIIKCKKIHPDAILPKHSIINEKTGDAGADLFSVENILIPASGSAVVNVGLQIAYIEDGYYCQIYPRSGLGFKHGLQPHLGTIDTQYRGSLSVKIYNFSDVDYTINKGDKIAQLIIRKLHQCTFEWASEIENTERGDKGFGSTGK